MRSRTTAPVMIVLLAVLVYSARNQIIPTAPTAQLEAVVESPAVEVPSVEPAATSAVKSADSKAVKGKIRKNSSLYVELTGAGVSPADVERVARDSKGTYNFRRVRAGQTFTAYLGDTGLLDSLEYATSSEERLKLRREGNRFHATMEAVPFDVSYHVTRGVIESSIFASLVENGAETELAGALDNIFGWTIDFIADTRRGDTYTILYERRTYEDGRSVMGEVLAARVVNDSEEHYAFRFAPEGQAAGYFDPDGKSLQKSLRRSPLKYTRVTSSFTTKRFHPVYKSYRPHYGVDYGAPRGTPVYATGDGIIQAATRKRGNGNYVKIKHNNTYTTYYLHLNGFARGLRSGKRVRQGQLIGYVGSTGAANGSHVCYRIKRSGSWVNPRRLDLPSKAPVPESDIAEFTYSRDSYLCSLSETIISGLVNNTIAVERPAHPNDDQMRTVF